MKKIANLIKSRSDKRLYLYKQLPNKLKCLLISDLDADKSAASVNVNVGALLDPLEYQGLAHFLEHMLFMGTEKYPSENDFSEFLNKNSGSSNAFTDLDSTNYYFDVCNEQYESALDRFSYFFTAPLFQTSAVEKEINAVDSENKKNLQTDVWRFQQLQRSETKSNSIFNKFSTGNLETLSKPEIRNALLDFHARYYSANVMNLVMLSNRNLEDLEKLADNLFSNVKNFDFQIPNYNDPIPFDNENLGYFYNIIPVKEINEIRFYWFLDDASKYYKSQPLGYFSSLFGHEGPNSLLSSLINDDLATGLSSGYDDISKSFSKFYITVSLTNKGLKEFENVSKRVLYFLRKIQSTPINKRFFEEVKLVKKIKFDFKNKEDPMSYCSDLAYYSKNYEMEDILTGPYLIETYDEELLIKIRDSFKMENMNMYLITKEFPDKETFLTEKWYGTNYKKQRIAKDLIEFYKDCNLNEKICDSPLDYPPENKFLPTNLDVLSINENSPKVPQRIHTNDFSEVWYKQDNTFLLPKANLMLQIYLKKEFLPHHEYEVLSSIWYNMFENELRELSYMASETNLNTRLFFNYEGLYLNVNGFNSSLKSFMIELTNVFRNLTTEDKLNKFKTQVEKITKELKNFYYSNSYSQAMAYLDYLLRSPSVEPIEKINILEKNIELEKLSQFVKKYLNNLRFSWLLQGNITQEETLEIVHSVQDNFKKDILLEEEIHTIRYASIPANINYYYILPAKNKDNLNSSIVSYYQFGNLSYEDQCCALVLESLVREKFFDDLRTKQQLGYVATLFYREMRKIHGFICLVQGSVKSPEYVKGKIHNFFIAAHEEIKNLSDEYFKENVNSVLTEKRQKDLKLYDESSRNFGEIKSRDFNFLIRETMIEILEKLEKSKVISFFEEHFVKNRKILDVEVLADIHSDENLKLESENQEFLGKDKIKRIKVISPVDFKRRVFLFPDFYSHNI